MRRILWRRIGLVLAVLLLVAGVAAVGLSDVSVPAHSGFDANLEEIRALALSTGQPLPMELRSQRVSQAEGVPRGLVVAGAPRGDVRHRRLRPRPAGPAPRRGHGGHP